jgi:hypothetical protein
MVRVPTVGTDPEFISVWSTWHLNELSSPASRAGRNCLPARGEVFPPVCRRVAVPTAGGAARALWSD